MRNAVLARQTEEQLGSGSNKNKKIHGLDQAHSQLGAGTPLPLSHLVNCLSFFSFSSPSDSLPESAWKNASRYSCLARKFDCILLGCWLDVGAYSSRHTSPDGQDLHTPGIRHDTARSLHTHNHPLTDVAESMTSIHRHS